jgi:hypothetical protein
LCEESLVLAQHRTHLRENQLHHASYCHYCNSSKNSGRLNFQFR